MHVPLDSPCDRSDSRSPVIPSLTCLARSCSCRGCTRSACCCSAPSSVTGRDGTRRLYSTASAAVPRPRWRGATEHVPDVAVETRDIAAEISWSECLSLLIIVLRRQVEPCLTFSNLERDVPVQGRRRPGRKFWTDDEEEALITGVEKYGVGRWKAMQKEMGDTAGRIDPERTHVSASSKCVVPNVAVQGLVQATANMVCLFAQVDYKDKWRNLLLVVNADPDSNARALKMTEERREKILAICERDSLP